MHNRLTVVGNLGRTPAEPAASIDTNAATNPEAIATLAEQLAPVGLELHIVSKASASYFEVRRPGEAYTCSTMHGVAGMAARMQPARSVEVA